MLFCLNTSLKALKQKKKIIKVQIILIRTCLISCYHYTKKKWNFPLAISPVNVTRSAVSGDLVKFTVEMLNGKLHFLFNETHYFQALNYSQKGSNIETFCMYLKYTNKNTRHVTLHFVLKLN